MTLLITGATGFVGRNLLLAAIASGRCSRVIASVRDPEKLHAQLAAEGIPKARVTLHRSGERLPAGEIDHAVHCAGVLFARDRATCFRVNVDGTLALVEALPADTRVVVLSSQSAGGPTPPGQAARSASDPDAPLTWYGESKLAMERRLREVRPGALVLRPPMILGPRDRATLPLFKMAAGPLRAKPGLAGKTYSWIAVRDLVRGILNALALPDWSELTGAPIYAAAPDSITDHDLIRVSARLMGRSGITLPLPDPLLRLASLAIDAIPALRAGAPSLTRDRVREIFADRWVVDGAPFRARLAPGPFSQLAETLAETRDWYATAGLLPRGKAGGDSP